ncbi:MAG: hypothetical protein A3J83_03380 [Elusimicrobia bacterium RIFOXYA2_FULL_40_6]|nr:MAG: hypothetical protein A3J83_03380 [Elusimicrobia bacterium RIFOXYA2_FULL_40_6]
MTLTAGSGPGSGVTTTDVNGYYEFLGLSAGNYTVTPSKTGYSFSQPSRSYSPLSSNQNNQDFTGTPPSTFYIKGYVRTSTSTAVGAVTVALSGSATTSTSTDSNGYYEFAGLATGNYTVTPSKTGYTFTVSSRTYASLSGNQDNQNFTANPLYFIIGNVVRRYTTTPISAVTMTLSGAGSGVSTTDDTGYYDFTGLLEGNYTVMPSKTGYTFIPSSKIYSPLNSNQYVQDFEGTPPATNYNISGYIKNSSSAAISAVTVTLSGSDSGSIQTDASGYYLFSDLGAGNYTVTPTKTGYSFSPSSKTYPSLSAAQDNQNYTGTFTSTYTAPVTYYIKGSIKDTGGTGIAGVTVALSGGVDISTATSADGSYQFLSLTSSGSYTITPAKTGYTFTPANIIISSLDSDFDNQDFTGTTAGGGEQPITEVDTVKPAEFHFGPLGAVKKKIKELKEKVVLEAQ